MAQPPRKIGPKAYDPMQNVSCLISNKRTSSATTEKERVSYAFCGSQDIIHNGNSAYHPHTRYADVDRIQPHVYFRAVVVPRRLHA